MDDSPQSDTPLPAQSPPPPPSQKFPCLASIFILFALAAGIWVLDSSGGNGTSSMANTLGGTYVPEGQVPPDSADCKTSFDINGAWNVTYSCVSRDQSRFNGAETMNVQQSDTDVSLNMQDETTQFSARGKLCGNILTWRGENDGYSEWGVWRVISNDELTKASYFARTGAVGGGSGECTGRALRAGGQF